MVVVDRLLDSLTEQQGEMPESIAFTLWGTDTRDILKFFPIGSKRIIILRTLFQRVFQGPSQDNIKTYGESLAQVLALVGARPVPDSLGRVNKVYRLLKNPPN